MNTTVKIFTWKWLLLIFLSLILLFFAKPTFAQELAPDEVAKKYGITFPIDDLENCTDYASCRTFCDDPVNSTACIEFAKEKGFYKEENPVEGKLLKVAAVDLGCDSAESCIKICEDPTNYEKCDKFAKKAKLSGGYVHDPGSQKIIEKAKDALGCDSASSCASFCQQAANRQQCENFARQSGIRGGTQYRGPGGCTTEATCRAYCSDPNSFNECSKFTPPTLDQFRGPGGCDSQESCRTYCEQNPANCRSYAPGSNGRYIPITCPTGQYFGPGGACTPESRSQEANNCARDGKYWNGNSCEDKPPLGIVNMGQTMFTARPDMGNCSTPGSCYDWCKANPGKCQGFDPNSPRPNDAFIVSAPTYGSQQTPQYSPRPDMGNCTTAGSCYDWCKANPSKCSGFNPDSPRPIDNYYSSSTSTYQPQPNPNMGNCTTAGSCYDWCKANPGKCSGFNPDSPRPSDNYYSSGTSYYSGSSSNTTSQSTYSPQPNPNMGGCTSASSCYDWCKANPGQCSGFNPDSPRPSDNYNYTQTTTYSPQPYTSTQQYTPPPTSEPTQQPQQTEPSPTSSTAPVMGVTTSILSSIINFFGGLFK